MTSNADRNKAAKRSYFDAFNARDLTIFDRLFDPKYVLHSGGMEVRGPDQLRTLVSGSFAAFADAKLVIDDMVAEGDKVATRWTLTGTHTGAFMGTAATQKQIVVSGTVIDRFVDGRIVEAWENFDMFGMTQQLGGPPIQQ